MKPFKPFPKGEYPFESGEGMGMAPTEPYKEVYPIDVIYI
jgi:hypothetical protein